MLISPLLEWDGQVTSSVLAALDEACPAPGPLHAGILDIVRDHSVFRLFGLAVLGSITGDPGPAVPVCATATFWWAGAEALDDLVDRGGSPHSLLTAVPCLTLLPQVVIDSADAPEDVRACWRREFVDFSLRAAEGQLADLSRDEHAYLWPAVVRAYVGKTGVAYGSDAAMAARLATDDEVVSRAWRSFGRLFGLLRQAHNDNGPPDEVAEDLRNGTPTLLLAHALEVSGAGQVRDPELLNRPEVTRGYDERLLAFRAHALVLLDRLTGSSVYRDVLRSMIDATTAAALRTPGAAA